MARLAPTLPLVSWTHRVFCELARAYIYAFTKIRTMHTTGKHQSVCLAKEVNWLRVWEAARDRGRFWANISQTSFKLLTMPLAVWRQTLSCDCFRYLRTTASSHISLRTMPPALLTSMISYIANLSLQDSDPTHTPFTIWSRLSLYVTVSCHPHDFNSIMFTSLCLLYQSLVYVFSLSTYIGGKVDELWTYVTVWFTRLCCQLLEGLSKVVVSRAHS